MKGPLSTPGMNRAASATGSPGVLRHLPVAHPASPLADAIKPAADPAGLRVTVAFTATNPNPFPITLSAVDYTVSMQGTTVFTGTQNDPSVPEHGSSKLDLSGVINIADPVYRTLRPGQSSSYTISGTAHVDSPAGVPVDVEFEGAGSFIVPGTLPTH